MRSQTEFGNKGTHKEGSRADRPASLGAPFGDTVWQQRTAASLGLLSALRERGRPTKVKEI